MRKYVNKHTGKVNIATTAKFVSMSQEDPNMKNKNNKQFRVATIEIVTELGEIKTTSAMVYEKNVKYAEERGGFKVGEKYLINIAPGDDRGPIVTLSPIVGAERLAADDFSFEAILEETIAEPIA